MSLRTLPAALRAVVPRRIGQARHSPSPVAFLEPGHWRVVQAVAPATTRYSMRSPMTFAMGLHAACADLDIFCLDDDSRPTR